MGRKAAGTSDVDIERELRTLAEGDPRILAAKAELIREMLAGIETLPLGSEAEFSADLRMVAAGESFLHRSLGGLLDLGRSVLVKGFGKVVPETAAMVDELEAHAIVSPESAAKLRLMARYHNRIVYCYDQITPHELYGILTRERGDIGEILASIQRWRDAHPELCDTESVEGELRLKLSQTSPETTWSREEIYDDDGR